MYSIYKITHKDSGKCYIGQTIDVRNRWRDHCYKNSGCKKLSRAIQKYGKDAFEWEVILICNEEMVDYYEIELIKVYDTIKNGYNITPGGGGTGFGEDNPSSKLTNIQRIEVTDLYISGHFNQKEIGELYGVSPKCIGRIVRDVDPNIKKINLKINRSINRSGISNPTRSQLNRDMFGEKHPKSKLTNQQRREICNLYETGRCSYREIGELYHVHKRCIENIIRNKKWQT